MGGGVSQSAAFTLAEAKELAGTDWQPAWEEKFADAEAKIPRDEAVRCWKRAEAEAKAASASELAGRLQDGATPLWIACENGHADAARLLLNQGVDINRADKYGATPLLAACSKGHVDAVRLLLDEGAEVDRSTEGGQTPLFIACYNGHVDAAQLVLDKGAEVDRANEGGVTPLWIACGEGHVNAARLLLKRGAEVNRAIMDGMTPLWIACQEGHVDEYGNDPAPRLRGERRRPRRHSPAHRRRGECARLGHVLGELQVLLPDRRRTTNASPGPGENYKAPSRRLTENSSYFRKKKG